MLEFSDNMREIIRRKTGYYPEDISEMTEEEENELIKSKIGSMPHFSRKYDSRKLGRGNVLLARRRFRTIEYINSRIDKLCKRRG